MSLAAILAECARLAAGGGAGALASVAKRHGSLPMSATAKLLVTAGGARMGTVGGGCLEAEIIERAFDVIERRIPARSRHSLNAELAGDYGLTCGGTAELFIEPVFPDPTLAVAYGEAAAIVARGDRCTMVTGLDWTSGPVKTVRAPEPGGTELPELSDRELVEPLSGKPRVVIFGGGHVGARIAEAAAFAGWRATVVDDRPDFADPSRLPFAERAVTCDFHDVTAAVQLDADSYVVIATRGHQHDVELAAQLAPLPLRYLGMLGSRRKVAMTAGVLRSWSVEQEAIDRMHAPVGLSIGADTPEEIAISVVAEMIAVRRDGSRRRGGVPQVGAEASS